MEKENALENDVALGVDKALDIALDKVGGYRRGSVMLFCMLSMSAFLPLVFHALGIVFIGWIPPHYCQVPGVNTSDLDEHIPRQEDGSYDSCHVYINSSWTNDTKKCTNGWVYESDGYSTIVTDFDLVCDRDYLVELSQAIQQSGGIISEIFGSFIIDRFGRKKTHIVAQCLIVLLGFGYVFAPNYVCFVCFRILASLVLVACVSSGFILMLELFDSSRRTFVGIGIEFFWVVSYSLLPLFAWLCQDWRVLMAIGSFSSAVWLIYICILPESPPWLAAYERYDEAEAALKKLGKLNGVHDPDAISIRPRHVTATDQEITITKGATLMGSVISLQAQSSPSQSVHILDLFKHPKLRIHLLASAVMWFANILMFYGLTLSTSYLGSNRFLSFFYLGLVEIPAYILTLFCISNKRLGRKISLIIFHVLSGLSFLVLAFVPTFFPEEPLQVQVKLSVALVAKFFSTCSFGIIVLYTRELFPASLRATSLGVYIALGRIGDILAPGISYLARRNFWLPNVLLGAVSMITILPIIPLPETLNKPLPLTAKEVNSLLYSKPSDS